MLKNFYKRICDWLSIKNITIIAVGIFILLLIPILGCSIVNRATGDDYGYSALTREVWRTSHSLMAVIKMAFDVVKEYYVGWQGTWFGVFLFTLQPEIFGERAYVIVAFLMLFLWISSTFLLFRKIMIDKLHYNSWCANLIIILFLIICISFIPSTRSAIFWYNGCAHYMIPFVMCQIVVYWLLKYGEEYKVRYLMGIICFMTLLGGANYQAALFALVTAIYFGIADYTLKREKRAFYLIIPIVLEMIGLVISMKSPGNVIRGGADFGFSMTRAINTILMSFVGGVKDAINYYQTYPIIFVICIIIFLVMLEAVKRREYSIGIKYSLIIVLSAFCLYSAMQAPAIYAAVDVSGGVYNTNFQVFMLMITIILSMLAEKVGTWLKENKTILWDKMHNKIIIPGLCVCVLLMLMCRSDIKETTSWTCFEYIATGQAADYKEQMEQLTELMTDDSVQDVVVPFINNEQGPLMHMPVTENPSAWTNTVVSEYYGKNSVVAIPRTEWEEKHK